MKILVVGGRLQGSEVVYLAKEAGWHVTLVDRDERVLAADLADTFVQADATTWEPDMFQGFDLVIPATENIETLTAVERLCDRAQVPYAFDEMAFRVSASKAASNAFLAQIGVPIPPSVAEARDWPYGYLVKPDSESGSHGVRRFERREDAALFLLDHERYVGQAFVDGPIYSIEVTCNGPDVRPHCVTEVVVGEDFDCYRIVAPAAIPKANERWIQLIGHRIGLALNMRGIFDVELVWCDGQPFVLEIDARMPSQTPIAIYHATGLNLVVELARCFVSEALLAQPQAQQRMVAGTAVLEHVQIDGMADAWSDQLGSKAGSVPDGALARLDENNVADLVGRSHARFVGESQISDAGPYAQSDGLLGADVALLACDEQRDCLFATLVFKGTNIEKA